MEEARGLRTTRGAAESSQMDDMGRVYEQLQQRRPLTMIDLGVRRGRTVR